MDSLSRLNPCYCMHNLQLADMVVPNYKRKLISVDETSTRSGRHNLRT